MNQGFSADYEVRQSSNLVRRAVASESGGGTGGPSFAAIPSESGSESLDLVMMLAACAIVAVALIAWKVRRRVRIHHAADSASAAPPE